MLKRKCKYWKITEKYREVKVKMSKVGDFLKKYFKSEKVENSRDVYTYDSDECSENQVMKKMMYVSSKSAEQGVASDSEERSGYPFNHAILQEENNVSDQYNELEKKLIDSEKTCQLCLECGCEVPVGTLFCPRCGVKVGTTASREPMIECVYASPAPSPFRKKFWR